MMMRLRRQKFVSGMLNSALLWTVWMNLAKDRIMNGLAALIQYKFLTQHKPE